MISTVSLYFGVSKPAKNVGISMGLGGFGVSKPAKNLSIFKVLGGFWVPKPAKNIGISMVFAGAAGARPAVQSGKEKRWHRKGGRYVNNVLIFSMMKQIQIQIRKMVDVLIVLVS